MSAAPPTSENGTAIATAPQKGVSLWADAWRRLKKNRMAMAGLWVVLAMSAVSGLAPLYSSIDDATYGFTWIRAKPPLYTHTNVLNKNELRVGQPPSVPGDYRDAAEMRFEVEVLDAVEYRVKLSRGKISEIRRVQGALRQERVEIPDGTELVSVAQGGATGAGVSGVTLVEGEPLPVGLDPGEQGILILSHLTPTEGKIVYEATVADGVVQALTKDGQPIVRVEFDGRDVDAAYADGELQTVRHYLGTDLAGRDLLIRTIWGGTISLLVGLVATVVSLVIGVVYGAVSGYFGGRTDTLLMAIVDVLYGIPYMFLVILLLVNFGRDIVMLFIALGAVQWLTMARIVRGQILSLKQKEFVEAARMSGTGHMGILFNHLVPNTLGVVIVYTTLTVPAVILQESFLAFIGLAVEYKGQSLESWGALVKAGSDALGEDGQNWWLLIVPSLAMAATLFSLNFLGDGLRDALDPQQRGRT